ncbi:MAG: hypothetical protein M1821_002447 [Bathelium mastoideum]|nr:MAG: hypothetical protein M1821_002447 [Bathelium mastoideum]
MDPEQPESIGEITNMLHSQKAVLEEMQKSLSSLQSRADVSEQRFTALAEHVGTMGTLAGIDEGLLQAIFAKASVREKKESMLKDQVNQMLETMPFSATDLCKYDGFKSFCADMKEYAKLPGVADSGMTLITKLLCGMDWRFTDATEDSGVLRHFWSTPRDPAKQAIVLSVRALDRTFCHLAETKWLESGGTWTPSKEGVHMYQIVLRLQAMFKMRSQSVSYSLMGNSYQRLVAMKDHARAGKAARLVYRDTRNIGFPGLNYLVSSKTSFLRSNGKISLANARDLIYATLLIRMTQLVRYIAVSSGQLSGKSVYFCTVNVIGTQIQKPGSVTPGSAVPIIF